MWTIVISVLHGTAGCPWRIKRGGITVLHLYSQEMEGNEKDPLHTASRSSDFHSAVAASSEPVGPNDTATQRLRRIDRSTRQTLLRCKKFPFGVLQEIEEMLISAFARDPSETCVVNEPNRCVCVCVCGCLPLCAANTLSDEMYLFGYILPIDATVYQECLCVRVNTSVCTEVPLACIYLHAQNSTYWFAN